MRWSFVGKRIYFCWKSYIMHLNSFIFIEQFDSTFLKLLIEDFFDFKARILLIMWKTLFNWSFFLIFQTHNNSRKSLKSYLKLRYRKFFRKFQTFRDLIFWPQFSTRTKFARQTTLGSKGSFWKRCATYILEPKF